MNSITALSHPNIAFIKYWGNQNDKLRLPSNGSISMNLASLETHTMVTTNPDLNSDRLILNDHEVSGAALDRVRSFLGILREMSGKNLFVQVVSQNNFPQSAGIASSASAFAALAVAGSKAFGMDLSEKELTILARRGSGSAARSIPHGFVEWHSGTKNNDSFAVSIAPASHWTLFDCIAIVSEMAKKTGSTQGHQQAGSSPLQNARISDSQRRLDICRNAILSKDFEALAEIIELDSNMMHSVMMTSHPPLMYWLPESLNVMLEVVKWRKQGIPVAFTLDAGPNVHLICTSDYAQQVASLLKELPGVTRVISSCVGNGTLLVS